MISSFKNRKKISGTYLTAGIAAMLVTLTVLVLACFAAVTYSSAVSQMELSRENADSCSNYYAAETAAVELLDDFASEDSSIVVRNGRHQYDTDMGKVQLTAIDGNVFFTVPIDSSTNLYVDTQVAKDSIKINSWKIISPIR